MGHRVRNRPSATRRRAPRRPKRATFRWVPHTFSLEIGPCGGSAVISSRPSNASTSCAGRCSQGGSPNAIPSCPESQTRRGTHEGTVNGSHVACSRTEVSGLDTAHFAVSGRKGLCRRLTRLGSNEPQGRPPALRATWAARTINPPESANERRHNGRSVLSCSDHAEYDISLTNMNPSNRGSQTRSAVVP